MTGPSLAEDEDALVRYADELSVRIRAVLGPWVVRSIRQVAADQGIALDDAVAQQAARAADDCTADIGGRVTELLATDIDVQPANPLQLLRDAVRYPSDVLQRVGARPVERDPFAVEAFPDDDFGLAPASFADIDESLHEPGLHWGAAKAHVHLRRRRHEGRA